MQSFYFWIHYIRKRIKFAIHNNLVYEETKYFMDAGAYIVRSCQLSRMLFE